MNDTEEQSQANDRGSLHCFGSLRAAKAAGWETRCRNIGPPDMQHYSAWVYHPTKGDDYLMSRDDDWELKDARREALARINEIEATTAVSRRASGEQS